MSTEAPQLYHAYLIRCWLIPAATDCETPAWRFELRAVPADPEKHRFSDLEQVKEYMSAKLATHALNSDRLGDQEENQQGDEP
jgi:hypothetical protein